MPEDIHSFEDGIEYCLAIVDDAKDLKQARDKITSVLCSVHEDKFERIRIEFLILKDSYNNDGEKNNGES